MSTKYTYPELLWAGSEHSLAVAVEAHNRIMAGPVSADDDEDDDAYLLSVQGGIGVVSVRGPLTNRDSFWNRYFGVTSYADIRRALVAAASRSDIQGILLDIDSGGGAVSGVADTSDLIKAIDKDVKPVWAFADGTMASAAYWIGSSARKVFSSKTSLVGSIGVIVTHMEYSKALKEAGVGVTVMRAGEYKALVNSVEPLSDTAARQMQDQLNAAYGIFIEHVADARGTTVNLADQRMGQGREFFGEQAHAAGLVDGISTFDSVLGEFQKQTLDSRQGTLSNYGKYSVGHEMKQALTPQTIAAIAAGAAVQAAAPAATADPVTPAADTPAGTVASTETPATATAATEAPAPSGSANGDLVTYLQSQLTAAQEANVNLRVELSAAQASVQSMKASHEELVKIAGASVSNMKVALGHAAIDPLKMSVEALLAEHAATAETFQSRFKAGGVAAVSSEPEAQGAQADPHWALKVKAASFHKPANA